MVDLGWDHFRAGWAGDSYTVDSKKSESLDAKGGLNSSDSERSFSDSDILVLSATGSASGRLQDGQNQTVSAPALTAPR